MTNLCDECGANAVTAGKSRPLSEVWGANRNYWREGICDGCGKSADVASYPDIAPGTPLIEEQTQQKP